MGGLTTIAGRDVVTLDTFSGAELRAVVDRALAMKAAPVAPLLQGRSMAMVFFDPSLRTRASFTVAFGSLGGTVIDMEAGRDLWSLAFREGQVMDGVADEHVCDAARVLSAYHDLIAIRALARRDDWGQERRDMVIVSFQKHARVPIFNMESVLDHPCQAWGDALTLQEHLGDLSGKKIALVWCYHPKARPLAVPHGVALMAAKMGMDLHVAHPDGYALDGEVRSAVARSAQAAGGSYETTHDRAAALADADVVYAASWGSTSLHARPEEERRLRNRFADWRLTEGDMAATSEARFMHAMPIRRNVEADDAVIDAPGSLIIAQATNRLHIQRALFCSVLGV